MNGSIREKEYNLEKRTAAFAVLVRKFVLTLPSNTALWEDGKQVIRSSGSIGANYIEACEALSKKDFLYRIKICRKEARETVYWLNIVVAYLEPTSSESLRLVDEATQLMKIFGAIVTKSESRKEDV